MNKGIHLFQIILLNKRLMRISDTRRAGNFWRTYVHDIYRINAYRVSEKRNNRNVCRTYPQVMLRMVQFTRNIVETDLSGSRSGDKWLASLVTNAFTNLVAQPRYLNYNSMVRGFSYLLSFELTFMHF
jgi:hypothetical protein